MRDDDIARIATWLAKAALGCASEHALLDGLCTHCRQAGLGVTRALAFIDTLHPIHEGRAFLWRSDRPVETPVVEYGPSDRGQEGENWRRTSFYHLLTTGGDELRRRFAFGDPADFFLLDELKAEGQTDYIALAHRFPPAGVIGGMDGFFAQWTTEAPDGFSEADIEALRRLMPHLALAIKCISLRRIASTLVEVYLGKDAGRRVLSGRITRGVADRIHAVLWFSDLRGYTAITDTAAPDEIIPLLNDYAGAVITSVHEAGGDVLKLIGDGILAIFRQDDPATSCCNALAAHAALCFRLDHLNAARHAAGRPVTTVYLGLHIGDVLYGNIGSDDRLDFTVVGPAVNEVSRIASMCRSLDRPLLMSADFVAAAPADDRVNLVSVGRYALRGFARAQELFTVDPELLQ